MGIVSAGIHHIVRKKIGDMARGIQFVRETEVVVGIPKEKNGQHAGGMKNSELLYLHCNGSPAGHIPPRNVLQAGIGSKDGSEQIKTLLKSGIKEAVLGNVDSAEQAYQKAGMVGAASVQKQFGVIPPPNAPSTVARKGSSATLIDTGALRQAITYSVRKKT